MLPKPPKVQTSSGDNSKIFL